MDNEEVKNTKKTNKVTISLIICVIVCAIAAAVFLYFNISNNRVQVEETHQMTLAEELGIDINDYKFILANIDNPIGEYAPTLVEIEHGREFDYRAAEDLKRFIGDCRAEGLSVFLSSTYRSYNTQKFLYDRKVGQVGEEKAKTIVLPPGTSEHQTGLCADITDVYYEVKNTELEDTDTFKWLNDHCQDYGFILRYPKDKKDITKVIYEPWHFRYVGIEAAKYMKENNLCFEEFLERVQNVR